MKQAYRTKKVVLESIKEGGQRDETPSRFPVNRFVLRKQVRQDYRQQQNGVKIKTGNLDQHADNQAYSSALKNSAYQFHENTDNADQYDFDIPDEYVEARDRRLIFKYDFKEKRFDLQAQKERLNEWLGQIHFKIVSCSFNYLISGDLTFQQVKVHCCQNLLLNLLNFLQSLTQNRNDRYPSGNLQQPLGPRQMAELLKHINEILMKNFEYMQIKYPLTKDSKPNKSLQSLITNINSMGNDEQDFILKSNLQFKLKEESNYTKQIMRLINIIIQKQSQLCGVKGAHKKQLTYFEYFYQTMERIFVQVYRPQEEDKEVLKSEEKQKGVIKVGQGQNIISEQNKKEENAQQQNVTNIFARLFSQPNIEEESSKQKMTKQQKEYKQKVMKYTHYLIGSKLSSNAQVYSEKDIQTQIFDVKNSSVLRIITKWTQQLQKKITNADENILKRPFRFKKNKRQDKIKFSKLSANQKNDLYQETKRRMKWVQLYNEQMQQNYNEIQSMLSSHLSQSAQLKNIPKNQYKVGFFCSKIQAAASSTLLSYLNKIIHILLQIPEEIKKNNSDQEYVQNMDINLITFKVGDLFRCKIKSKEAQIVRIFKKIIEISQIGEPFKIVRIKDRLNQGTRDILINILFKSTFLSEIQLAVEEYVDVKQKSYDRFSHFLYEMHRSRLGPIMQSACTWAQFDQRVKIYRQIGYNNQKQQCKMIFHKCSKEFFIANDYPFVCSLCQKFYASQIGLIQHKKCVLCKMYYQCSVCIYNKMNEQQISTLLKLSDSLGDFINDFALWRFPQQEQNIKFPEYGLIINKKMKKPQIIFYQTIVFKYDTYIINLTQKTKSSSSDSLEINIIQKISGKFNKVLKKISQKYIIYQWKQLKEINRKITPNAMRQVLDKEARQRQQQIQRFKEDKKKKIEQLEKKRKQQMERIQRAFKKPGNKKDKDKTQDKVQEKIEEKSQKNQQQKENAQNGNKSQKIQKYNEKIFKRIESMEVRVIVKQSPEQNQILVLGIYVKQFVIRNKLRNMKNQNLLKQLLTKKIQVLFLQDENIQDQINDASNLNQAQEVQLQETLERITEVYLDYNCLTRLTFVELLKNLKVGHFSNNAINDIDAFKNAHQITELILQNNQIEYIQLGLQNKKELITLNLNRNQICQLSYFSHSILQENNFQKIKDLYLSDNQITQMDGLEEMVTLTRLDLSYNRITTISPCSKLVNLQELDLSYNRLQNMKGIKHFTGLKKLYLNQNGIKIISKEIVNLKDLTILFLDSNFISKINYLSKALFAKTIKIIHLDHNKLTSMEGLDGLQSLQQLYLNNNEIRSISNYFDLSKLRILDLSFNSIQELNIDKIEQDLTCLKTFSIRGNVLNDNLNNRNTLKNKLFGEVKVQFLKKIDFQN